MIGNGPFMLETPRTDKEIVLVPQPRVGRTTYYRARPARVAVPRQDHLPGDRRPRHLVQLVRGRRGRDGATSRRAASPRRRATTPPRSTCRSSARTTSTSTCDDPVRRRRGEPAAPPGHLAGHRPRRDQRGRLRGQPHGRPPASRPPGIPGCAGRPLRRTAPTTPRPPRRRSTSGRPRATRSTEPIRIQFNAGAGHEDVVAIIIDNLAADRHRGRRRSRIDTETYFTQMADGACVDLPGRLVRRLPDVRQLHVRPVPHRRRSAGTTTAFSNAGVRRAGRRGQGRRSTPTSRPTCSTRPRRILLNDDVGVIPINWYRGDYVYNEDEIGELPPDELRSHHLGERVQQAGLADS